MKYSDFNTQFEPKVWDYIENKGFVYLFINF